MKYMLLILLSLTSHAEENRIKIAVVDTGIKFNASIDDYLCSGGHFDATGTGLNDVVGHGTNVAGLIAKHIDPKTHCLIIYKFFQSQYNNVEFSHLIDMAVDNGAQYINISATEKDRNPRTLVAIQRAVANNVYVVVAAGNNDANLSTYCYLYPACFNIKSHYFKVVANFNGLIKAPTSNYGGTVNTAEDGENQEALGIKMSGTSQATAIVTGKLVAGEEVRCLGKMCYK